jgi:hypothetical protein
VLGTIFKRPVAPGASQAPASIPYSRPHIKTNPGTPAQKITALVFLALIIVVVLGTLAVAGAFSSPKPEPVPSSVSLTDGGALDQRYDIEANRACSDGADDYLRSISRYEFKWEDVGFLGHKFDQYLTTVQLPGVLTMKSDRALRQNGFGAFRRVTIWCNYDTQSGQVLNYK